MEEENDMNPTLRQQVPGVPLVVVEEERKERARVDVETRGANAVCRNPLFDSVRTPMSVKTRQNPMWSASATAAVANAAEEVGVRVDVQSDDLESVKALVVEGTERSMAMQAAAALGHDRPEEGQFEEILRRMMTKESGVSDGVLMYAHVCATRAQTLKELAGAQLQETARYHELVHDAAELESEASTWKLLWFMYGNDDRSFPAGMGGDFVEGTGFGKKTFRQRCADLLYEDATLNKAARVVAWLEEKAVNDDPRPEQGLARKDGVWQETKARLDAKAGESRLEESVAFVKHIDPDAMTRECARIDVDNRHDEERLGRVMWRLVKSGRIAQAAKACEYAGQPWRAASLTGCGPHGPLPLAQSAEEADMEETGDLQAEILAGEVDADSRSCRALWRWTNFVAADKIASLADTTGHGTYEAAVFGILSGNLKRVLPACACWEDVLWANTRSWLEYQIDTALIKEKGHNLAQSEDQLDIDILAPNLNQGDGVDYRSGIAAFSGDWPNAEVAREIPERFSEAVKQGSSSFGGLDISDIDKARRFRKVQIDVILGQIESLLQTLVRWITPPADMVEEGPPCPPAIMRFSAHLALLFWSLGTFGGLDHTDDSGLYTEIHDTLQRLVWLYAIHLIDSGSYFLAPIYLVRLRQGLRRTTTVLLVEQATIAENLEVCHDVHDICNRWFAEYKANQGFQHNEMGIIVQNVCVHDRHVLY